MKPLFTLWLILVSAPLMAQFPLNALPSNESDSLYNYNLNQYQLQYNVNRYYDVNHLDSFRLSSNASGPYMKQFISFQPGTTYLQPLGRSYDLRPRSTIAQLYQNNAWVNYANNVDFNFTPTYCVDSFYSAKSWGGSSWYLTVGRNTTATFLPNGSPSYTHTLDYDYSSGLWLNFLDKYYYYNANNQLRSTHYRQWSFGATSYEDYIDSNIAYSVYNNYCDQKIDTLITYKKTGATYLPYGKTTLQHFPFDGYISEYSQHNGTTWVKSMKYEYFYDQYANDSSYKQWHWNSSTQQYDISTWRSYTNTYDGNGNLIRQEVFKNLNSATPYVLYPYSVAQFSNFVPLGVVTSTANTSAASELTVYPNPTSGSVTISIPEQDINHSRLSMCDITGRIVFQQTLTSAKTTLQLNQPSGVYMVRVSNTKKTSTQKLVIR